VFTKNNLTESEQKLVENLPAYQAFFSEVYEIQRKSPYLREQSNFHDISLIFENDPQAYFVDFVHVNEEANNKIARRMFPDIQEAILGVH